MSRYDAKEYATQIGDIVRRGKHAQQRRPLFLESPPGWRVVMWSPGDPPVLDCREVCLWAERDGELVPYFFDIMPQACDAHGRRIVAILPPGSFEPLDDRHYEILDLPNEAPVSIAREAAE